MNQQEICSRNQQEINCKKMKKAFRLKLLELCKTRAKKSSPDLLNFCAVLAGHNTVTDTGRAITCRRKFKASSLQTKSTKNEVPFENMGFNEKQFEKDSNEKKYNSSLDQTTP